MGSTQIIWKNQKKLVQTQHTWLFFTFWSSFDFYLVFWRCFKSIFHSDNITLRNVRILSMFFYVYAKNLVAIEYTFLSKCVKIYSFYFVSYSCPLRESSCDVQELFGRNGIQFHHIALLIALTTHPSMWSSHCFNKALTCPFTSYKFSRLDSVIKIWPNCIPTSRKC